jgi:hypothetical protein
VQYVALRNILLIIQRRPAVLKNDVKVFFCKYNDPIYVKLAKLEIMYRLARSENCREVLAELQEWAYLLNKRLILLTHRFPPQIRVRGRCRLRPQGSTINRSLGYQGRVSGRRLHPVFARAD